MLNIQYPSTSLFIKNVILWSPVIKKQQVLIPVLGVPTTCILPEVFPNHPYWTQSLLSPYFRDTFFLVALITECLAFCMLFFLLLDSEQWQSRDGAPIIIACLILIYLPIYCSYTQKIPVSVS